MNIKHWPLTLILSTSALGLGLMGAASGCAGELDDPQRFVGSGGAPVCPDIPNLLRKSCAAASCHSGTDRAASLDLETSRPGARMVDIPSPGGACQGQILATPKTPADSLLYRKIAGTAGCGEQMPLNLEPFDAKQLDCVSRWIARQDPDLAGGGSSAGGSSAGGANAGGGGGAATGGAGGN